MTSGGSFLLEICVDSVDSARAAETGGAGRIELCQSLIEGGITPSLGLLQTVRNRVTLPIQVLIRPRGGDFLYSEEELTVMETDVRTACANGADGIVIGALNAAGAVDRNAMTRLIAAASVPVTFHRAIDMTRNPLEAIEAIIDLGCVRMLTSGGCATVLEGTECIRNWMDRFGKRISIMPGGGIREENFRTIRETTGAMEFHLSARKTVPSEMQYRNKAVRMGSLPGESEFQQKIADVELIRRILSGG